MVPSKLIQENGSISWTFIITVLSVLATLSYGAIQLGVSQRQIDINTVRLNSIEEFNNTVRTHDADTTARVPYSYFRLDDLARTLGRLQEKVESHVEIDSTSGPRTDNIEKRLDLYNITQAERISKLENVVEKLTDRITKITSDDLAKEHGEISDLKAQIVNLQSRINELQSQIANLQNRK